MSSSHVIPAMPGKPGARPRFKPKKSGWANRERGALAIVVTEMVTNLVKHARDGSTIISKVANNGAQAVRVLALDKGPGIRDLECGAAKMATQPPDSRETDWGRSGACRTILIFLPLPIRNGDCL